MAAALAQLPVVSPAPAFDYHAHTSTRPTSTGTSSRPADMSGPPSSAFAAIPTLEYATVAPSPRDASPASALSSPSSSGSLAKKARTSAPTASLPSSSFGFAEPVPPATDGIKRRRPTSGVSDLPIAPGPGQALADIPMLLKRLEKVSNEDSRTKLLYAVCFPQLTGPIPERSAKKTLRLFSGYATPELRAAAQAKLEEFTEDMDLMRKVARLLDLSADGSADHLVQIILDYLSAPYVILHAARDEYAASATPTPGASSVLDGGSGSGAPRKRKPKEKRDKRPPNPYLLFATDHREEVTAASPGLQMMEVNRLLGQLWQRADEATKSKYVRAAEEARVIWDREHPELARPAGGSARKRKRAPDADAAASLALDDAMQQAAALSDQDSVRSDPHRPSTATPSAPPSGSSHAPSPSPAVDHQFSLHLQSSIARILSTADLNRFSLRQVKAALAQEFSEKVVAHHQRLISTIVDQELLNMP